MHAYVLIDTVPGFEDQVFRSLSKVPAVIAKRQLREKIGNAEILVIIGATDEDAAEKTVTNELRGISGVHSVRSITVGHTVFPKLRPVIVEMEREATAAKR